MFSKTLCIALLSLTLSSFTAQAAPSFNREPECGPASVSIRTVTVTATAPASESTTKSSNHNNFDTINNSGHNFDNNSNSHNKNTNSKGSFNSKDKGHSHDKGEMVCHFPTQFLITYRNWQGPEERIVNINRNRFASYYRI